MWTLRPDRGGVAVSGETRDERAIPLMRRQIAARTTSTISTASVVEA